jgi:hypothetical protein
MKNTIYFNQHGSVFKLCDSTTEYRAEELAKLLNSKPYGIKVFTQDCSVYITEKEAEKLAFPVVNLLRRFATTWNALIDHISV